MSMEDGLTFEENGVLVVPWTDVNGRKLRLLTPKEYLSLPLGTKLGCINGQTVGKSVDSDDPKSDNYVDQDIRFGRLAFGLID